MNLKLSEGFLSCTYKDYVASKMYRSTAFLLFEKSKFREGKGGEVSRNNQKHFHPLGVKKFLK